MKITLHPLFIALGLATAIFGGLPVFLIYVLTALLHECGHIFCAARLGFTCEKISLMPYGASATYDTEGISPTDEIKLAIAGPAVNALICIFCAGLWWFYPVTYPYTETVFKANAVTFLINILPAYPLDGGRIARCLLCMIMPRKAASIALRVLAGVLSVAIVFIFIFAYKNISFLIFAGFLLFSAFEKESLLTRINYATRKIKRGREIKHVMLNENSTFKDAIRYFDGSRYLIFQFYSDGILDEITEDELFEMMQSRNIYDKILE